MQKMNIKPKTVFRYYSLKCGEYFACRLRTRFSPDTQFSQNHVGNYRASIKAQNLMLAPINAEFVLFTQLSRQHIQFSNTCLCHFLVYIANYPQAKDKEHPLSIS